MPPPRKAVQRPPTSLNGGLSPRGAPSRTKAGRAWGLDRPFHFPTRGRCRDVPVRRFAVKESLGVGNGLELIGETAGEEPHAAPSSPQRSLYAGFQCPCVGKSE